MREQIAKLARAVRSKGLGSTLALARKNIAYELRWYMDRRFDRMHGTETSERIELANLEVVGGNRDQGVYYEPTSTRMFRRIMSHVVGQIASEDFVFIDYGSGKGRTLLLASDFPFRSIVGVEFSRELHESAQRNIARYSSGRQRCRELTSVHADATLFVPPASDLLVYFFNPFLRDVMTRVLDRLTQAARASGTRIVLVYLNPQSSDVVENCGLFVRSEQIALPYDYTREFQRQCRAYYSWDDQQVRS